MAKFRPQGRGTRFPQRAGGSKGSQLNASVNAVTASLQTQRQAWTEVISSLNEYRAIELPDFSQSLPDVSGWTALTDAVNSYSAAIAAIPIPSPTVATFTPGTLPNVATPSAGQVAQPTQSVSAVDPSAQIAALNAIDAEIDDQATHWASLAAVVMDFVDGSVSEFGEFVVESINAADGAIEQHKDHWLSVSQSITASIAAIKDTIGELADTPAPQVSGADAPTDSRDLITETTAAIAEQTAAWQELSTSTTASVESLAATAAAMQELIEASAQTKSGVEGAGQAIVNSSTASREQLDQTVTVIRRNEASWGQVATTAIGALTVIGQGVNLFTSSKNALAVANVNATIAETTLATATMNAAAARATATAAIAGQTAATVIAIPPTFTLAGAMALLTAPLTLIVGGLTLAAGAIYYFTRSSEDATDATEKSGDAAEVAARKAGSLSLAYEAVAEQAKNVADATKQTGQGLSAVETAKQSIKGGFFPEDTEEQLQSVAREAGKVVVAWEELKATLAQPVIDAGLALGRYAAELLGVKSAAESATATLRMVGDALDWTKNKAKEYSTELAVMAHMVATGSTEEEARAFVEQGQAILETSARIDAMTARMEEQRQGYQRLRQATEDATDSAARGAEMARIGSITTLSGIEAERAAIARKAASEIEANARRLQELEKKGASKDEISAERNRQKREEEERAEALKKIAELEQGIKAGRVETGVDAATRKTTEAIQELTLGHTEHTIAVMRAEAAQTGQLAAFEAGLPAYRAAQAELEAVKQAQEQIKKSSDELARTIEREANANKQAATNIETLKDKINLLTGSTTEAALAMKAMQTLGVNPEIAQETAKLNAELQRLTQAEKGADKITALRDQIDLLNGSATAAQIAMRELGRDGFSDEQIAEIGALTTEVDRLKDSQKKGGSKSQQSDPTAAFVGSKEAAEIMLRGVGGGSKIESIGEQQLAEQKKISAGVAQKPVAPTPQAARVPSLIVPPMPAMPEIAERAPVPFVEPPIIEAARPPLAAPVSAPTASPTASPTAIVLPNARTPDLPAPSVPIPSPAPTAAPAPPIEIATNDQTSRFDVQKSRIAEADTARTQAENAARRAGLNPEQVRTFGQEAWEKSERTTAPKMEQFATTSEPSRTATPPRQSPSPQIPTAATIAPPAPARLSPQTALAQPIGQRLLPLPTPVSPSAVQTPVPQVSQSTPTPTSLPVSAPSPSPPLRLSAPNITSAPLPLPELTLPTPSVSVSELSAVELPAPPVTLAEFDTQNLAAPPVMIDSLPEIRLPAPQVTIDPIAPIVAQTAIESEAVARAQTLPNLTPTIPAVAAAAPSVARPPDRENLSAGTSVSLPVAQPSPALPQLSPIVQPAATVLTLPPTQPTAATATTTQEITRPVPVTITSPVPTLDLQVMTPAAEPPRITQSLPPLVPPAAPLTATAAPVTAAPVSIPPAASIAIPKFEAPRFELPPQRAGVSETPKISGISERVTEPRRNNRENEMVDLLRSLLQEEKLNTAAIKELEMPNLQVGAV